jgi:hypothetical protein
VSGPLPAHQASAVVSDLEQLLGPVGAIQVAWRDANARLVLLFSALDTLQTLTNRDLATNCKLSFAEKTLGSLRERIPADAAEILLPAADERAVDALREVQRGFFPHRGEPTFELGLPNGTRRSMTLESATATYIQLLRDANHGHGSRTVNKVHLTEALLAQHTGEIPHDLGLLAYLYLLEVSSLGQIDCGGVSTRASKLSPETSHARGTPPRAFEIQNSVM